MADTIVPNLPQGTQEHNLDKDITVGEALQNGPPLDKIFLGDGLFLEAVKSGYKNDPIFFKVLENPGHYLNFRVFEGIIRTKNRLGDECLCIPRALYKGKRSLPKVTIMSCSFLTPIFLFVPCCCCITSWACIFTCGLLA